MLTGPNFPQRVVLLEAWKSLESSLEGDNQVTKVEGMMPRVVKKRRRVDEDGSMEECAYIALHGKLGTDCHADFDLIFQDDEQTQNPASFKLLQLAHQWKLKQQQAAEAAANGDGAAAEEEAENAREEVEAVAQEEVEAAATTNGEVNGDADMEE